MDRKFTDEGGKQYEITPDTTGFGLRSSETALVEGLGKRSTRTNSRALLVLGNWPGWERRTLWIRAAAD